LVIANFSQKPFPSRRSNADFHVRAGESVELLKQRAVKVLTLNLNQSPYWQSFLDLPSRDRQSPASADLIEVNRAAADEQVAFARFHEMDFAVLHSTIDFAGSRVTQHGGVFGQQHPNSRPAPLAPGVWLAPAANGYPLPRRHGDFGFGFRSLHGATALRFCNWGVAPK